MSFLNTLRDHAGKLLAAGALSVGLAYGHNEINDPGEELYSGETEEGPVVYREDVGHLEIPFDGLEKNVMEVEQDGKTYIIEDLIREEDLNLENRQYTEAFPDRVIVKTGNGKEVYERDGEGTEAVIKKAKHIYNDVREDFKQELVLQREFQEDMLDDRAALIEKIDRQLDLLPHTYRDNTNYTENFNAGKASNLSLEELNQVYMMLEGMQDEETLTSVGNLIRDDFKDGEVTLDGITDWGREGTFTIPADSTEIGGLVRKTDDGIEFVPAEPASTEDNKGYHLPMIRENIPAIAGFHLHAVHEDGDAKYAGPSGTVITADLGVSAATDRSGVVLTYLGTDEEDHIQVNLDFYRVDTVNHQEKSTVIDLGDYDTGVKMDTETPTASEK